jgi:hypothetical protein
VFCNNSVTQNRCGEISGKPLKSNGKTDAAARRTSIAADVLSKSAPGMAGLKQEPCQKEGASENGGSCGGCNAGREAPEAGLSIPKEFLK